MTAILKKARDAVDLFDRIAERVLAQQRGKRFIEKTPEHALRLEFMMRYFPNAQFIFMVRDPRDGYLSVLRNPTATVRSIPLYAELWKRSVQTYLNVNKNGDNTKLVRYEELCRFPETVMTDVMEFLHETFDFQQLNPSKFSETIVKHQMGHERLATHISDETVGQWCNRLTAGEIELFERMLGNWMKKMGYETKRLQPS